MKVIELVTYLKSEEEAMELAKRQLPNAFYNAVDLFMVDKVDIESEVAFFDRNIIGYEENDLRMTIENINYVNFLPLHLAQEMVQDFAGIPDEEWSNNNLAKRLMEYKMNDA